MIIPFSTEFDCHCSNCKETLINDEFVLFAKKIKPEEIKHADKITSGLQMRRASRQIYEGHQHNIKALNTLIGNAADIAATAWREPELR